MDEFPIQKFLGIRDEFFFCSKNLKLFSFPNVLSQVFLCDKNAEAICPRFILNLFYYWNAGFTIPKQSPKNTLKIL